MEFHLSEVNQNMFFISYGYFIEVCQDSIKLDLSTINAIIIHIYMYVVNSNKNVLTERFDKLIVNFHDIAMYTLST